MYNTRYNNSIDKKPTKYHKVHEYTPIDIYRCFVLTVIEIYQISKRQEQSANKRFQKNNMPSTHPFNTGSAKVDANISVKIKLCNPRDKKIIYS